MEDFQPVCLQLSGLHVLGVQLPPHQAVEVGPGMENRLGLSSPPPNKSHEDFSRLGTQKDGRQLETGAFRSQVGEKSSGQRAEKVMGYGS